MKVLVTGSQGFIGSTFTETLLSAGASVHGIDSYIKYGKVQRQHDNHINFRLYELDLIKDFAAIRSTALEEKYDYIVHFCSRIGGISFFHKFAHEIIRDNSIMDALIVDLACELHSMDYGFKRFVGMSSSMIYESAAPEHFPTQESCIDKIPPPISAYGFSKLQLIYQLKAANKSCGLEYSCCVPFNAVGINENEALGADEVFVGTSKLLLSHVLPDLIHKAMIGGPDKPLEILGNGEQCRCYTNTEDLARGIMACMIMPEAANEIFNLSVKERATVKQLAEIVWRELHGNTPLTFTNAPAYEYDVQMRQPDVSKAERVLGFTATTPLVDSVRQVIRWMKSQ